MNKSMTRLKLALSTVGLVLVGYYGTWQIALGVFMLIWANNFDFIKKE